MKRWLLLVALLALAWQWWPLPVPAVQGPPPPVAAPDHDRAAPVQRDLEDGPRFVINGIAAHALAEYTVSARVLSTARYRLGRTASLAPLLISRSIGVVRRSQSWNPCCSASMSLSSESW